MNVALLILRVVVGSLFAGHGSQKLFGWFGGHGLKGTGAFFENTGMAPGVPLAFLAGAAEVVGGVLLACGLFVPVAALLIAAVMATAIAVVHWKNGVWAQNGGFEFPLVMAAVSFAVAAIGAGSISLDNAFGIDWHGLGWARGAVGIGALVGLTVSLVRIQLQRHRVAHTH